MNLPNSDSKNSDLTGRTLGDYTILRRLGRGGMADVYLARQKEPLERNIALKVLKPELAKDESYVRRFHREAQSAATVVQANIVQIYDVKKVDGLHFIAQEYVRGRNLRQYLDRHGAVEPVMAITVLRQCAMALQKAAEFSVIHRDIKPENIMLSTSGEVKVTDFGLARINNDASQQALTQVGITMGTPLYMSPEQVEGRALDARSDIYSLGVTAYHMLAGHPPFEGENALAIAVQQVKDDAVPLQKIRPDVPEDLCEIIHRMISKEPGERPQSPTQLLKEIRKVKIDVDEDWDVLIDKLSEAETGSVQHYSTVSQAKLAATQQLQSVMKGNVKSWWKNPATLFGLAASTVLALSLGILLALYRPPLSPLDVGQVAVSAVPRESSVEQQHRAAYLGSHALGPDEKEKEIEYWQAVLDYFPLDEAGENSFNTRLYHCRAKARLGEVFLAQEDLSRAREIYKELEDCEDISPHFRVTGIAGHALILDLTPQDKFPGGREEKAVEVRRCLSEISSKKGQLNGFMRAAIEKIESIYSTSPMNLDSDGAIFDNENSSLLPSSLRKSERRFFFRRFWL